MKFKKLYKHPREMMKKIYIYLATNIGVNIALETVEH